jgi:hypothetical protein
MVNDSPKIQTDKETAELFIRTFSDTAREPILILNPDLTVVGANASFYKNFQVTKEETENRLVYDLGNGQWNIPELKNLLEDILPEKRVLNDFEVSHTFPQVGLKTMLLNARQLDHSNQILLAIEDITAKRAIEIAMTNYTKELEQGIANKTEELKIRLDELQKINSYMVGRELKMIELKEEIVDLKKSKAV